MLGIMGAFAPIYPSMFKRSTEYATCNFYPEKLLQKQDQPEKLLSEGGQHDAKINLCTTPYFGTSPNTSQNITHM